MKIPILKVGYICPFDHIFVAIDKNANYYIVFVKSNRKYMAVQASYDFIIKFLNKEALLTNIFTNGSIKFDVIKDEHDFLCLTDYTSDFSLDIEEILKYNQFKEYDDEYLGTDKIWVEVYLKRFKTNYNKALADLKIEFNKRICKKS